MFKVSFVIASVVLEVSPFFFASSFYKFTFEIMSIIELNRCTSFGLSWLHFNKIILSNVLNVLTLFAINLSYLES